MNEISKKKNSGPRSEDPFSNKLSKKVEIATLDEEIGDPDTLYPKGGIDALYKKHTTNAISPTHFDINSRNTPFDHDYFLKYYYSIDSLATYVKWDSGINYTILSPKRIFNLVMIAHGYQITNYGDIELQYFYEKLLPYWLKEKHVITSPSALLHMEKPNITIPTFIEIWSSYIKSYGTEESWKKNENHYHDLKVLFRQKNK